MSIATAPLTELDNHFTMGLTRSTSTMRSHASKPSPKTLSAAPAPNRETKLSRTKSTGNSAAMELWDLIHHSGPAQQQHPRRVPSVPRYTSAQTGRTLVHPLLVQPNAEEEAARRRQCGICTDESRRSSFVGICTAVTDESFLERNESPECTYSSVVSVGANENQVGDVSTQMCAEDCINGAKDSEDRDCHEHVPKAERKDAELRDRLCQALFLGSSLSRGSMLSLSSRSPAANLSQFLPSCKGSYFPQDLIRRDDDGYLVGEGEELYDENAGGPSPTSTLHFPDPYAAGGMAPAAVDKLDDLYGDPPSDGADTWSGRDPFEEDLYGENGADEEPPTSTPRFSSPFLAQMKTCGEVKDVGCESRDLVLAAKAPVRTTEMDRHSSLHTFVVCSDSQIGMTSRNREWETELNYCRRAIRRINSLHPRPRFVCVCGDLVDMEYSFHTKPSPIFGTWTKEQCDEVQDRQNEDFKRCWEALHPSIGLVCICGNHDVGNRPTPSSIDKFRNAFGDDYLSFWCNGTYNVVLNNVLFSDPTGAPENFDEQLRWLESRLSYARSHGAAQIFVFAHHPWFLYHEDEADDELTGSSAFPLEWEPPKDAAGFPDFYFHIKKERRKAALDLFRTYGVDAAFVGHFHQNLISRTEWGMEHVVTAPLSMVFESSGKPRQEEENGRGIRIVEVQVDRADGGTLEKGSSNIVHWFEKI